MTLEAETIAEEARAKYEASLQTLRAFIADFPAITQRVDEHDERLNVLENRFMELRREISSVIAETSRASPPKDRVTKRTSIESHTESVVIETVVKTSIDESSPGSGIGAEALRDNESSADESPRPGSKVSWAGESVVWRYSFQEEEAIIPVHGHWLPTHVTRDRKSFDEAADFAKKLGGRMVPLAIGIEDADDPLECVLVEPMGKILSPNEYISTGLVICLDGAEHNSELGAEWGEVLKATRWLDSGISFALPDVSGLAEASDVERVVEAALKQVGFETCILAGKGWGAQLAAEVAAGSRLCERIDGILLVGPESPVPAECSRIPMPVMLLWAHDDEESPFHDIRAWFEVLSERRAPTLVRDPESGGHHCGQLLKHNDGEIAAQVLHFTVSCLLLGILMQTLEEATGDRPLRLSDPCTRLCDELPCFLASQVGGDPELGVAHALSGEDAQVRRRLQRLTSVLKEWIKDGLQEMASATE